MSRLSDLIRSAFLTACSAPFAAQALPPAPTELSAWNRVVMEATFSKADTNDDGKLTWAEAIVFGALSERFDDLDANHDGVLDLEEFAAGFALAH